MDGEQPNHGASGSLSFGRAAVVLVGFVIAVAVLVAVGSRPTPSSTASTTSTTVPAPTSSTTVPTTAPGGGAPSSTTTSAPPRTTTTAKSAHRGGTTTTTTTVPPSSVSVVVANATSTSGLAAHYTTTIGAAGGWSMKTPLNATTPEPTSAVYYAPGMQQPAQSIAASIGVKPAEVVPISSSMPVNGVSGIDVVVVIGQDLVSAASSGS